MTATSTIDRDSDEYAVCQRLARRHPGHPGPFTVAQRQAMHREMEESFLAALWRLQTWYRRVDPAFTFPEFEGREE